MEAIRSPAQLKQTNKILRIAHIVQHLQPGGIETMVLNMANGMRGKVQSRVISLQGQPEELLRDWQRLSTLKTPWIGFAKENGLTPSLIIKLRDYFLENKIDVVHTHHIGPLLYGGLAAKMAKCRVIHTEHDAWHLEGFRRRTLQKAILRVVRPIIVADAEFVAHAFEKNTGIKVNKVIPNGVDVSQFRSGNKNYARAYFGFCQHGFWVGTAGRLELVKDHKTLLDAMVNTSPTVYLAIAGDGSQSNALKQYAQALGITDRVVFLGHVEQMKTFYQAIDCFCLPSLKEGYPISTLEAQACSVPCIVTDTGGSTETLCPLTGTAVPVQRPDLLSHAITHLYHHTPACDPRKHVFEHNHFDHTMSKYFGIYTQGAYE